MDFTSTLDKKGDSGIYHWFFSVPNNVASAFIDGKDRRVICTVNGTEKYHCAIHGDGNEGFMIMLNRQRCNRLGLVKGESIEVQLVKDTTEYGIPMCDELREVLDQMPQADDIFHGYTKGKQRTLIYWVQTVKKSEIRIRRSLVMATHLEQHGGDLDYKLLNSEMKEANMAAKRR